MSLYDRYTHEGTTVLGLPIRIWAAGGVAYVMAQVDGIWHDIAHIAISLAFKDTLYARVLNADNGVNEDCGDEG